jgi:hypothetical protein
MLRRHPERRRGGLGADALWCLVLTVAFELVSCLIRFGFQVRATRGTRWLRGLTFGLRIHHGYFGVLLIPLVLLCRSAAWRRWGVLIGLALIFSDLAHHFLVLGPLTGNPEFDLVYPD